MEASGGAGVPATRPSLYGPRDRSVTSNQLAATRPTEVVVGAVFLTLAALPVAVLGLFLGVQPGNVGTNLRQKITASGAGVDVEMLLTVFRTAGVLLLAVGVAIGALAWRAARPNQKARTAVTVIVVILALLLVGSMLVATPDPASIGVLLLSVAGIALLYLPRSSEFIAGDRR